MALPLLSIIIPAYNEEKRLPSTLDRIADYCQQNALVAEVIVVDDGSTDSTALVVRNCRERYPFVTLLQNPGNHGKGYSVRHGMTAATGEWRLFTDADLSSPIEEFSKLYDAAARTGARVAIGSRALDRTLIEVHQPVFREYSGRVFNSFMRLVTGLPFRDTQCGFKLYHCEAAAQIFSRQLLDGFSFDVEDLMIARLRGVAVIEVPVRWANAAGTKVTLAQAVRSFVDVACIRWNAIQGRYGRL